MVPHSIYLHIPFCQHRCNYCDFNTYAGLNELAPVYVNALIKEIQYCGTNLIEPIHVQSIYFGGGTPSLLPAQDIERILQALIDTFEVDSKAEITLEANPGTLSRLYLQALYSLNINRLSIGMQSAHPGELGLLERTHSFSDVINAVKWSRQVGFENLSLDLIMGLPQQDINVWRDTLDLALGLAPEHFSLYALTIEPGTTLGAWYTRGLIPESDPDRAADMYDIASDVLEDAGYLQYEISNWAKSLGGETLETVITPKLASQHNVQYWRNQPYLGLGAGAHGYANGSRTENERKPASYIRLMDTKPRPKENTFPSTPATVAKHAIGIETEMRETMMMGLRLTREGVSEDRFKKRFGLSIDDMFADEIQELVDLGLLEWVEGVLRLTVEGRLLGNQVFGRFV